MNKKIRRIAGVLAIYILVLPILLVIHAQSHLDDSHVIHKDDVEDYLIASDTSCEICDLYFSQQLFACHFKIECDFNSVLTFYNVIIESGVICSQEQFYLRGPPLV